MACLSPVAYGVLLTFRALGLRRSRLISTFVDPTHTTYSPTQKNSEGVAAVVKISAFQS